jgi:ubiquinone/menaquinone biosynthesis C-methylase UbiE
MNTLIYKTQAEYYDLVYSFKDYKKEADAIFAVIAEHRTSRGKDLLDVGCGTGKHVQFLKTKFRCEGIDANAGVLQVARRNLPGMRFTKMDMTALKLKRSFDVITCLFSAIGYVIGYPKLERTIRGFAEHLKPGGVVVIEPWLEKRVWKAGTSHLMTYQSDDLKIARMIVSTRRGNISILNMDYLVAERNKPTRHFVEQHRLFMSENDRTLKMMRAAGLQAKFIPGGLTGRGLLVGVKIAPTKTPRD